MRSKASIKIISSLIAITMASPFAMAQKNAKNQKNTKAPAKSKKATVADLLSRASQTSRGAGATLSDKGKTNLPFSDVRFQKDPSAQRVNLEAVKPPRSSTILRAADPKGGDYAEYEKILDRQINELYKLTQKFKDSNNRGELWLRLAELYVEKSTIVDARIQDAYDKRLRDFQDGKTKQKPVLNTKEARSFNTKAVQLYEWFQRDFPRDPKMAQALFFLGYNYFELGEVKKGASYYERLVAEYPKSPFVGEARFALGEYYFENDQWAKAYNEYANLIKAKNHRLHTFSLYKASWCLFRLGKYNQALKYMEYIIKANGGEGTSTVAGKKVNNTKLESEALRDIVVFYGEGGDPDKASDFFRGIAPNGDAFPFLEKLAYYYSDRGNKQAAQDMFKLLISEKPTNAKAFEYQYQIVQSLFYAKNTSSFREELVTWVRGYGPSSDWYKANINNKELITKSDKLRETTLKNYVLQQHQTAQNSRAAFSQKSANEGYQLYIAEFPTSESIADMRFYHGELLFDMGKHEDAYGQYKWVVENAPKNQFYEKAGQNMLIAIEKTLPKDSELQARVGDSLDPIEMDQRIERFIAASRWYMNKFPRAERIPEIKFRVGRLYYQHNRFDEAAGIFREIVEKHPKTKQSEYSANLLLDIFNLKKDYAGLEKTGAELLAVPSIADSKAGADIRNVLERASFKKGQELEVNKDFLGSADTFWSFAQQNAASPLAVTAMFNAGVNYERANSTGQAIMAHEAVLNSKDDKAKEFQPKSRRLLAKLYQDSVRFEEAAATYRKAYEDNPKDALAANMLFNSAILYEALGNRRQAASAYEEYLKVSRSSGEKADAHFSLATIYRKNGQKSFAIVKYTDYLNGGSRTPEKEVEAAYWLSQLNRSKTEEYEKWKNRTISLQRRASAQTPGLGASYAAKLKMEDAKISMRELTRIKFPANPARQKEAVDRKTAALSKVLNELGEVIKFDSAEELVGALTLIGDANNDMARTILDAPTPSGLTPEQLTQYKEGVAQFAQGFLVKAEEAYTKAVERGWELQVYNEEYQRALAFMNKKDPKAFYLNGEVTSDVKIINWMTR
ncbi:MAG: tetratricopeptide repeat protein [Bdellovibrionia bacterium]